MESDPRLIEIDGEDDSLLQQTPTLDAAATTTTATYFSFSPLQIRNSNRSSKVLKGGVVVTKPSCSSPRGSNNKENINVNKSEAPKLSVEPQQMKRRKKGGGYNLRKSLAWDRAFFTEEGVLDPQELSLLGANFGTSSGELLSVIHEEGRKSSSGDSECSTDSAGLGDRENGSSSLLKHTSSARDNVASTSVATPKVLQKNGSRTGPKGGVCPRPLASPSLKRPANASTKKATSKESKLPRLPVSKLGPRSFSTATKSTVLGATYTKHKQIAQSGDSIQANAGLRGFSKNTNGAPDKAKYGPGCLSAKSSLQPPRRNRADSPSELHSSTNLHPPLVSKTNVVVTPVPVGLPTGMHAPDGNDVLTKTELSFARNNHSLHTEKPSGLRMPSAKPSGLRMPSPSLGFFGQSKSSTSSSLSQRTTQPCNLPESSIFGQSELGASNHTREQRPPLAPGKIRKVVSEAAAGGNAGALGSSMSCAAPSAVKKVQMTKVACDPEIPEVVKSNTQVHNITDADKRFQGHVEPDKGIILESQGRNGISITEQDLLTTHNDTSRNTQYLKGQSVDQAELIDPSAHKDHQIYDRQNHSLKTNGGISFENIEPFEQSQKVNNGDFLDVNPNNQPSSGSEMECSYRPSQHQSTEKANEGAAEIGNFTNKNVEDVQMQFMDGSSLDESCSSNLNASDVHTQHIIVDDVCGQSGEHPEPQSSCGLVEQTPQFNHGFHSDGCFLVAENISSEEYQEELGAMQDGLVVADKMIEQPYVAAAVSRAEEMLSSVENHDGSIDTQFRHYINCRSDTLSEFYSSSKMSKDHTTDSDISTPVGSKELGSLVPNAQTFLGVSALENTIAVEEAETNFFPDSPNDENQKLKTNDGLFFQEKRSFKKSRTGDLKNTADFSPVVQNCTGSDFSDIPSQLKNTVYTNQGEAGADNTINKSNVGDTEMYLDSHLLVGSCNSGPNNSAVQTPYLMYVHDANKQIDEGQMLQVSRAVDENILGGNQVVHSNDCLLLGEGISFEEHLEKNVLDSAKYVVPQQRDDGSESHGGDGMEEMDEHPHSEAPSGPVEIKSSAENHRNVSIGTHFGHDVVLRDQAISPECNSGLSTSKAQTTGDVNTHKASCSLNDESGLLVQTSSNESSILDIGVDVSKYILPDEIEVQILQKIVSPIGKMVVADANELSGGQLILRNPCMVDECVSQDNHGLKFKDQVLHRESTNSEGLQEEKVHENVEYGVPDQRDTFGRELEHSNVVAHASPAIQDGGTGVEKLDEHRHVVAAPTTSVVIELSAVIDKQFRHDMELCGCSTSESDSALRMDVTEITDVVSTLNGESGLLGQMVSNENCIVAVEADRINCTLPDETEVKISQNIVTYVNELGVSDINDRLMLRNHCIANDCASQDDHNSHFSDYLLVEKSIRPEELLEDNFPDYAQYVVPGRSNAHGSESKSLNAVDNVSSVIHDDGTEVEKLKEHLHVEDAKAYPADIEPSPENYKYSLPNDAYRSESESANVVYLVSPAMKDDATYVEKFDERPHVEDAQSCPVDNEPLAGNHEYSMESNLDLKTHDAQTTNVVPPCKEFSLSDDSGFWTTSNKSSISDIGVDGIKCTLPDETEVKRPQNSVSPVVELHRKLDDVMCLTENDDATKPIKKSENGANRDNLMIKPPANAIPFSDEWLAAMEAAGEDILTMKSGAVQHSPPDKSAPEPGPWSPVKRKNNQIGPYDCTKFTNISLPDSH